MNASVPPGDASTDHDQVAAYALDALDDLERARARAHLAGCAACRQELEEFQSALAGVADHVAVDPPPAMRADVLARIATVAQVAAPVPVQQRARVAAAGRAAPRRAPRQGRLVAVLAAAAAVLLVAAGGLGWSVVGLRADRDAARAQARTLTQVVAAPDAVTVGVATATPAWQRTRVVLARSEGEAVVVAGGAPSAPSGHTWQLWWLRGGTPVPAGVMSASGPVQALAGAPGTATGVAVTLEPAGGSRTPTTTPVATFTLPSA